MAELEEGIVLPKLCGKHLTAVGRSLVHGRDSAKLQKAVLLRLFALWAEDVDIAKRCGYNPDSGTKATRAAWPKELHRTGCLACWAGERRFGLAIQDGQRELLT